MAGFAAQLIAALEEAEAAAAAPKPAVQLAEAGWSKLQFDFPVVSAEELTALAAEYADGKRTQVSARFLQVLREAAVAPPPGAGDAPAPSSSAAPDGDAAASATANAELAPLYQRLYAAAVLGALRSCLEAPDPSAAAQLAGLAPQAADLAAQGGGVLEEALEAGAAGTSGSEAAPQIERELRASRQEDDDSVEYELLEPAAALPEQQQRPAAGSGVHATAAGQGGAALPSAADLPELLAQLAGHLSYHCISDAAAWRELRLMQCLAGCLATARRDRAPVELEAALPALLDALAIPGGGGGGGSNSSNSSKQDAAAAAAAAELALSVAVTLAGQVSSPGARRHLWAAVHARLLPVAAAQLEAAQVSLARAARASADAPLSLQQLYAVALPCQLLYFYVLEAPRVGGSSSGGSSTQLQEAFLKGGLLRALVLLFCQLGAEPGAEPLRCALLLACGAAQPLAEWAAAVPGFAAAVATPMLAPGGASALHGALWRLLLGGGGGELAALLGDAEPADKVPGLYQALQLMADLQAVSRRPTPLWGGDMEAALRTLGGTLRTRYGRPRQEAEAAAAGGAGNAAAIAAADAAEEAKKLGRPAEEQAPLLAARRAAQLQPACLKLVKDLLHARRGGGGAGKHD
ncbi:hypothetical protein C2E20_1718 [Micractinium conductrix]|uniref:Uncharacterized protein n=1 Tax=Micractinium conductrix TaxID=554055 RepID=A0A2P6VM28_9CHLO|nr:hypothetical protein C2E20_1718 [Micractinium conductrix]|eukprot:PSC75105.1 hypothetical protein C2E20_1718 [Micractinium conductrix]